MNRNINICTLWFPSLIGRIHISSYITLIIINPFGVWYLPLGDKLLLTGVLHLQYFLFEHIWKETSRCLNMLWFLVSVCCRLCPVLLLNQEEPQLQDTGEAKLWKTERKEPGKLYEIFSCPLSLSESDALKWHESRFIALKITKATF